MGTLTSGRFKFFKPLGTEFVDPNLDMDGNFNILDDSVYNFIRYRTNSTGVLPTDLKIDGAKLYDYYSAQLKILRTLDGGVTYGWVNAYRSNNVNAWTKINFLAPYVTGSGITNPDVASWRWTDPGHTHVELRGKFWNGSGALVNNANTAVTNASEVPAPAFERAFEMTPGISSANNPASNSMSSRISVLATGVINYAHYGTNNSTVDNYISLDNIVYAI